MGSSKTFRQGPNWQGVNTNRGAESSYSKGDIVKPEGTHMSGNDDHGRKGAKGRDKSSSGRAPVSKGYGQS